MSQVDDLSHDKVTGRAQELPKKYERNFELNVRNFSRCTKRLAVIFSPTVVMNR